MKKKLSFEFCDKAHHIKQHKKCKRCKRNIFLYIINPCKSMRYLEPDIWVDDKKIICKSFLKRGII